MERQSRSGAVPPQRSRDFEHLGLAGLRQYRQALSQEEGRVSYWRRILQARLDLIRSADGPATPADAEHLRPMLAEHRVESGRRALIDVVPVNDIPPLPNLEELWERWPRPGDPESTEALIRDLSAAEAQLSAYRTALHRRLGLANTELIARYRENPSLCLSALPLDPRRDRQAN